jgi:hypothetical protein
LKTDDGYDSLGGTIWRNFSTTDGGATWVLRSQDDYHSVSILLDSLNGMNGYERTSDGGKTWYIPAWNSNGGVAPFFISPTRGYSITGDSMYLETWDGGNTWHRHETRTAGGIPLPLTGWLKAGDTMHLMSASGFSDDGGLTWAPDSFAGFTALGDGTLVTMTDSTTAYALSSNGRNALFKLDRHAVPESVRDGSHPPPLFHSGVRFFPDPVRELGTLEFDGDIPEGLAFARIFSVTGALERDARVFVAARRATLPLGGLAPGVHVISLTSAAATPATTHPMRVVVR